jgi:Bacterial DNA-binding protein
MRFLSLYPIDKVIFPAYPSTRPRVKALVSNVGLLGMKKAQLVKRLAKESGISPAAAADQLDGILTGLLRQIRHGHSASLPGLGTFLPGPKPDFYFEQSLPTGARRVKVPKVRKASL